MPELPEVETVRRQLDPEVVGRRIERTEVLDERWTRPESPATVERVLAGRTIESVSRRGKYLILGLDGGRALVMHLRMTGNLLLRPAESGAVADLMESDRLGGPRLYESTPELQHLRASLDLDDGSQLLFTDVRRFGTGVVLDADDLEEYLAPRAGIEPLTQDLTAEAIGELAALWRAQLHPLSPAGSMRPEHWEAMREGIVETLEIALANRGSSIDDYRDLRGERGSMQEEFVVHTREGQECFRCGTEIRRIVVGGRSTYFCPGCQTRLRRRRRSARGEGPRGGPPGGGGGRAPPRGSPFGPWA